MEATPDSLQQQLDALPRPLLVLSTAVGRGMYSIGEALVERAEAQGAVEHRAIEDFLPPAGVREDLERYRLISSRFPTLLHIAYRFPLIYARKLWRERRLRTTPLDRLQALITEGGYRSLLTVSHRPSFWTALAKERAGLELPLVGLSGKLGSSLGWRYLPWGAIERFLSPVPRDAMRFPIPAHVAFDEIELPARRAFKRLAESGGDPRQVLLVCGWWGQGRIDRVITGLLSARPDLQLHAVCGENERLQARIAALGDERVQLHGLVPSLAPLLERCGSVISKPGIATILEAHAARRALFLMPGMPVAEDNNMRHALTQLGAQRYRRGPFLDWVRRAIEAQQQEAACPTCAP